jgi:hypothetical protein
MLPDVPEDGEQEEALRERLAVLATAAGVDLPALQIVPDAKRHLVLASPDFDADEQQPAVEVSEHLVTASAAEQDWYLAACVGWWASPVPRRRLKQWVPIYAAALLPHFVFGLGQLTHQWSLPKALAVAIGSLVAAVLPATNSAVARRVRRALEEAGQEVLRRAGRDPAAVAREAFGGRSGPPWYRRPLAVEPTPAQRIALAERHQLRPQPALF